MQAFITYDPSSGEIQLSGYCQDGMYSLQASGSNIALLGNYQNATHYVSNGIPTPYSDAQAIAKARSIFIASKWSNVTFEWIDPRSLLDFKAIKNSYINNSRLIANQGYFTFTGKQIAVDSLSRSDIDATNGVVTLTNEMPDGWLGAWKAADNSYVIILDVATWTLFYKAMVGQGSINFAHAQNLKAQLAKATTIAEVEAIKW